MRSDSRPLTGFNVFTVTQNLWPVEAHAHTHPFTHTFTHRRRCQPCKATASSSLQTPRHSSKEEPGFLTSCLPVPSRPSLPPEPRYAPLAWGRDGLVYPFTGALRGLRQPAAHTARPTDPTPAAEHCLLLGPDLLNA